MSAGERAETARTTTTTGAGAHLVLEAPASAEVEHGCRKLVAALQRAGEGGVVFLACTYGAASRARDVAARAGYALPSQAEAVGFCVAPTTEQGTATVVIAGGDERGLMYALLEAARRIELHAQAGAGANVPAGQEALLALFPASSEAPAAAGIAA